MARSCPWFICLVILLAACDPDERGGVEPGDDDDGPAADASAAPADASNNGFVDASTPVIPDGSTVPPDPDGVVYGHSPSSLYTIDPDTFAVTLVAPFGWPANVAF